MTDQYRARRNAYALVMIVWLFVGICIFTAAYGLVFYDTNRVDEGCDASLTDVACNEDAARNISSTTIIMGLFGLLVYLPFLFGFAFQTWRFQRLADSVV